MTPNFALTLSRQGVALLHRARRGWLLVGEVSLDDPALDARLAVLRATALSMAPEGLATKLVIPGSEILYTEMPSPGADPLAREMAIRAGLEGATPYPVEGLVFDWNASGEILRVAVVARQTLEEAEAFADGHGFAPVSFVACPAPGQFPGEPFFGPAARLGDGARVERDVVPVEIAGQAEPPAAEVTPIFGKSAATSLGGGDAAGPAPADPSAAQQPSTAAMDAQSTEATRTGRSGGAPEGGEDRTPEASRPAPGAAAEPSRKDRHGADAPPPLDGSESTEAPRPEGQTTTRPIAAPAPRSDDRSTPPRRVAPSPSLASRKVGSAGDPQGTPQNSATGMPKRSPTTETPAGTRGPAPLREAMADQPAGASLAPGGATDAGVASGARADVPSATGVAVTLATLRTRSTQPLAADGSATDAEAMTVFGARRPPPPSSARRSGLMVTAALGVALAGVGIWAGLFLGQAEGPSPQTQASLDAPQEFGAEPADGSMGAAGTTATTGLSTSSESPATQIAGNGTAPRARPAPAPEQTDREAVAGAAAAALRTMAELEMPGDVTSFDDDAAAPAPVPLQTAISEDDGRTTALGAAPQARAEAAGTPSRPNIGTPPPSDPAAGRQTAGGTQPADMAGMPTGASAAPTGGAPLIEVTAGSPDLIPELRRSVRSRHLLVEGNQAVPDDVEPQPRPPGLGGDGTLLAPQAAPPDLVTELRQTALVQAAPDTMEPVAAERPAAPVTEASQPVERNGRAEITPPDAAHATEPMGAGNGATASLWSGNPWTATGTTPHDLSEGHIQGAVGAGLVTDAGADRGSEHIEPDIGGAAKDGVDSAADTGRAVPVLPASGPTPRQRPASLPVPTGPTHLVVQTPANVDQRAPLRPGSIVDLAAAAEARLASATARAVATSPLPGLRPSDFGAVVARAQAPRPATVSIASVQATQPAPTPAPAAAVAPQPPAQEAARPATAPQAAAPAQTAVSLPTRASVAQQATESRALNLRQVNLIGVFGTSSQRRALVRLSNGQITAVRVGDRLDGGQVAAIGDNELRYVRNGRNTVLRIGG
ncbi:MAG: hypothetical protein ACXIUV_10100 [Alkalilacustris sp.]